MGELLSPFAGLIEARINPILRALDQLPVDVESQANSLAAAVGATPSRPVHLPVAPARLLRPPGALPLDEIAALCARCSICVHGCPAQCIRLDPAGMVGDGLPYIIAEESPCVVCDDLSCMKNCPTGALKLVDRLEINMGLARVTHSTCLRNHGEDCRICVEACPLGAEALIISADSGRVRVKRDGCIGCGVCEKACPTEPRAIVVLPARPAVEPIVA